MQPHTKNYLSHLNLTESDFIACEVCKVKAVDIHHIIPRSRFGKKNKDKQDHYGNLIALCRFHHEMAHASTPFNNTLHEIVWQREQTLTNNK